jgi:hypothetical protein
MSYDGRRWRRGRKRSRKGFYDSDWYQLVFRLASSKRKERDRAQGRHIRDKLSPMVV